MMSRTIRLWEHKPIRQALTMLIAFGASMAASIDLAAHEIKIATVKNCPFSCDLKSDAPGLYVEYIKAIFKDSHFTVNFQQYPWDRAVKSVENGSVDAILGVSKNDTPHLKYPNQELGFINHCFFVLNTENWTYQEPRSIKSRYLLHGFSTLPKEIIGYLSTVPFHKIPYSEMFFKQAVEMLTRKRVNTVIAQYQPMQYYLQSNNSPSTIKSVGCIEKEAVYLGFFKDHQIRKVIPYFDEHKVKNQAFYNTLVKKYFSK